MQDHSDAQLLREFAERRSELAFREIVTRHTDLVYSAALRHVESSDLACDVAQGVFIDLAGKARPLAEKMAESSSLVGWLYRSTRYAALNLLRDNRRRLAHERLAMEQLITNPESAPDWGRVRPVLDEAMADLSDDDREALLLRYFKNHDFRAVGRALGVSDDAAQKRVSRAVERLREFFAKRGVTVGSSGLLVAISANAVQSAPVGLAATISTAVTTTAITTATIATHTTMHWINIKSIAAIVAAALAAGTGTNWIQQGQANRLRKENLRLIAQQEELANERDTALSAASQKNNDLEQLRKETRELPKLRGEIGLLRRQSLELGKLRDENERLRARATVKVQPGGQGFSERLAKVIYRDKHSPKETWVFAGYADPEAALATWTWAMNKGDKNVMFTSLAPEAQPEWQKLFEGKSDDQIVKEFSSAADKVAGYSLHSRQVISENEAVIAFVMDLPDGSQGTEEKMRVKKFGEEWKIVGPAN